MKQVAGDAAGFCCASLGIVPTVRHADYLGSWLEVVREDIRQSVSQPVTYRDYLRDARQRLSLRVGVSGARRRK